ncbi:hypothetical protein [Leptothoe spongobia]|uniref:Uncharacterized protein n=1 Tax=Leptothoe spongobia TAU-MAC 1115 TaxID=1967444 RepID=A0A947DIF6_9CYAN|nr:hypothetical protein [Leptothoe spongobia]MBT9317611.1 hypothetical protein [Leptothoe spongobia TAU-MAC 1115]
MNDYRAPLRRVGIVLILIGMVDIIYMIYALLNDQSYSSWLNILAVIAGGFLLRGKPAAVPIVTCCSAFAIASFVSTIVLYPFLRPLELWAIQFRLEPVSLSVSLLMKLAVIILLCWVYKQLWQTSVVSASRKAGHGVSVPRVAFILGALYTILPFGVINAMRNSAGASNALKLARTQYGNEYKYHLTGMDWSEKQVRASFTAYNEQEIKLVQVEWQR